MIHIGLATSNDFADLTPAESALIPILAGMGVDASPVIWENENADLAGFDTIIIRSCWDYHLKVDAFRDWLHLVHKTGVRLGNPYPVLLSNIKKSYLKNLQARGVNTVPTEWISATNNEGVSKALKKNNWSKAVLKPVVSASAFETHLISMDMPVPSLRVPGNTELMLQPFLPEVTESGEWSLIFFNKNFSHAILKKPKKGDFRVQQELGGTATMATADEKTVRQARDILHLYNEPLLYARVDGIVKEGEFQLMELELIEPELFLMNDTLLNNFARAIKRFVTT